MVLFIVYLSLGFIITLLAINLFCGTVIVIDIGNVDGEGRFFSRYLNNNNNNNNNGIIIIIIIAQS